MGARDQIVWNRAQALYDSSRYQMSFSTSMNASVSLDLRPLGGGVGLTRGATRNPLPQSLPEVVENFRGFVEAISSESTRTLIVVDELDKMANPEDAEEFLNDIKGVFGLDNSIFVLSVSEDALASFVRVTGQGKHGGGGRSTRSSSVTQSRSAKRLHEGSAAHGRDEFGGARWSEQGGSGDNPVMVYQKRDLTPRRRTRSSTSRSRRRRGCRRARREGRDLPAVRGLDQDEKGISRMGGGPAIAWSTDPAGNITAVLEQS